jgi:hypothetical protein
LVHDGGNETEIEDLYLLVNATTNTDVELGSYDITSVEKIRFHIGVDSLSNHLDPSSFHASHPLSPKSPSMHWGWIAGYRFIAYEGFSGSSFFNLFQIHGLGNKNYFTIEVELNVTAADNKLQINLDADYTRGLENISIEDGLIMHGDDFEAKECLENFRDYVFSPSSMTSSTIEHTEVNTFNLFPNPVTNGISTIELDVDTPSNSYDLSVNTLDGKQVFSLQQIYDGQKVDFTNQVSGIYFINLHKKGQIIQTKKIFIK